MKVTAERIPDAQIVLEIELDTEQTNRSLDQAARRLAQRYRIPGFRKGKAPRRVVENTLGPEMVLEEAFDRLIPKAYDEAIEQEGIEPIGAPDLEILEREPVRFKATVPLAPVVDLGDYKLISVEKETAEITDEMVADTILELQRQHAVLEPVERPVQYNDRLRIDVRAEADGSEVMKQEGAEFSLREEMTVAVPGLAELIPGLTKGPEHELSVDVPDDYQDPDVAGKTVQFFLTVHEVQNEILPDLDDDFATEVGEHKTFDELRNKVRSDLQEAADQRLTFDFQEEVLAAAIKKASVEFPPFMVEHEIEHMIGEMAQQSGQDAETYVRNLGAAAAQIRASLRERGAERVLRSVVLSEATDAEGIEVDDDDVRAEIDKMIGDSPGGEQLRTVFESDNSREMIRRNVVTRKTLEALGEYASTNFANGVLPTIEPSAENDADEAEPDAESEQQTAVESEQQADSDSAQDDETTEGDDA